MSEVINVRCQKCKQLFEENSKDIELENYMCQRCNKNTGKVIEKEEVNPRG